MSSSLKTTSLFSSSLSLNQRITSQDHFQDVRKLEFSIPPHINYRTGDVVSLLPSNLPEDVDSVLRHFKWEIIADDPFELIPNRLGS